MGMTSDVFQGTQAKRSDPSPSFLAWLPFLWSRVLFPGQAEPPGPLPWRAFLVLLVVPAILLYPCLAFHLFEPDEGRYAQIPCEMLQRGDWVVPYLQNEPYLDKPPLVYWLVMISYGIFGIHEWSARLVPALAVHAGVVVTFLLGRRILGNRAAWWGAMTLTLTPAFLGMGRLLILDGVLALWVALSLFSSYEAVRGPTLKWNWWLLAALACGLGILTKGPIALVLFVPPLWLERRLMGQGAAPGWRDWAVFLLVVLMVALPWYLAVCLQLPQFGYYFLWQHNVVRFLMPFDHNRPIWYYGPLLLLGLFPASLLLVPFLRFLGAGRAESAALTHRSPELGFVLLAGSWCVLFFSLSGSKLPTYVLPALPFLCLALGCYLVHGGWNRTWTVRTAAILAFVVLAVGHWFVIPRAAWLRSPMNPPETVLAQCGDPDVPVVCYPRPVDSVAFYLGRSDFRSFRSKQTPDLIQFLLGRPKTVVLFSHRHSLQQLRDVLPPELVISTTGPLGACDLAVVENKRQ